MSGWVVGAEAVEVLPYGSGYGHVRKVAKVHKTGRFVFEGGDEQYSPHGDLALRSGNWTRKNYLLLTDENRAKVDEWRRAEAARCKAVDLGKALQRLSRPDALTHLEAIEALLAALERRP